MRRSTSLEHGFTIVELAVTVLILGIVVTVLFGFLDSTTSVTARTTRNVSAEQAGQIALRTVSQDVRAGNPITATYPASPTSCPAGGSYPAAYGNCLRVVVVRSDATGPSCTGPDGLSVQSPYSLITYALVSGQVLQDRSDYSATCTVVSSYSGRTILDGVVNSASTPMFTFLDRAGVATSSVTNVSSVKVALDVRYQQNAPDLQLSSVVALRNYR